jgi:integrase
VVVIVSELDSEAYNNFINSINSDMTRKEYDKKFSYFMQFCQKPSHKNMLLISASELEGKIRDYIVHLRHDKKLAPATVSNYIAPISHFYEMNDTTIKWKKLNKFKAKRYSLIEDRPYSRHQIKTLVDAAPLRDKCIILIMASAGLRRGAIQHLRIRDLQKIDNYKLYRINVYKKEQEQYITFCTPECTRYIDKYLEWRQRIGEQLKPNSPLFRVEFDTITQVNLPKPVSFHVIASMMNKLLDHTGIRVPTTDHTQRTELMQTHGFRKFFKTTCINAGMNPLYSEYLMGHRTGLTKSYFKPSDMELLEGNEKTLGYVEAINDLTIAEEHRLAKKLTEKEEYIKQIETAQTEAINELRIKVEEFDRLLEASKQRNGITDEDL